MHNFLIFVLSILIKSFTFVRILFAFRFILLAYFAWISVKDATSAILFPPLIFTNILRKERLLIFGQLKHLKELMLVIKFYPMSNSSTLGIAISLRAYMEAI